MTPEKFWQHMEIKFRQHIEMKETVAGDAAGVDDSEAEKHGSDRTGLSGRVESIFFFLVTGGQAHRCDPDPILNSSASGSDRKWFVESLQKLVKPIWVACPPILPVSAARKTKTWIEWRCAPRVPETNRKVNRDTDGEVWAEYVVVHRSVAIGNDQDLWGELDLLHRCSSSDAKFKIPNSSEVSDPTLARELQVVVDVASGRKGDPAVPCQKSTGLVLATAEPKADVVKAVRLRARGDVVELRAQGGAVALLGTCFDKKDTESEYLRMFKSPEKWTRARRWLWAVGECPPVYNRCTNPRLEQRDAPLVDPDDAHIFFDIAGREATVGRSAVVMLDARPLKEDAQPSQPQLQLELLQDYVHNKLADALTVAFTQRHVLYGLSTKMASANGRGDDDLDDLIQDIFDFRRVWWWEHLHRHPTSRAFTAFQQYWRLPSLMAQLATEVTDYYQRKQQEAARRLNRYGALIAVLATYLGLLQVSGVSRLHGSYLELGLLGVAVTIPIGVLLWKLEWVRRRWKRVRRWMGRK